MYKYNKTKNISLDFFDRMTKHIANPPEIKQNEAKLQLGEVTNLQDIFLTQKIIDSVDWNKTPIKISIGEHIVKEFGLGGADQFGLNILLKDLLYDKATKEIIQNEKRNNICPCFDR